MNYKCIHNSLVAHEIELEVDDWKTTGAGADRWWN